MLFVSALVSLTSRVRLVTVSVSIVFFFLFSFLTFLSPHPLLTITNTFCRLLLVSTHLPRVSLNVVLPSHCRSSSTPFPLSFLGICSLCPWFSYSFHTTNPFLFLLLMVSSSQHMFVARVLSDLVFKSSPSL